MWTGLCFIRKVSCTERIKTDKILCTKRSCKLRIRGIYGAANHLHRLTLFVLCRFSLPRGYEGRVLRYGSYVFPDVNWLTSVLMPILQHKEMNAFGKISLGNIDGNEIVLSAPDEQASWKRLETEGILEPKLAQVLWPGDLSAHIMTILQDIDLAFPLPNSDGRNLVVILRLPEKCPASAQEKIQEFQRSRYSSISGYWKFPEGAPPGSIEKMMARSCRLGTTRVFWRYGVLIEGDVDENNRGGSFAFHVEYSVEDGELRFEVFGSVASVGP